MLDLSRENGMPKFIQRNEEPSAHSKISVVDIFAGPGGLGEGFEAYRGSPDFKVSLSVEKDRWAHRTLELRSFFRQFSDGLVPELYYGHVRGDAGVTCVTGALYGAEPCGPVCGRPTPFSVTARPQPQFLPRFKSRVFLRRDYEQALSRVGSVVNARQAALLNPFMAPGT